MKEKIFIGSSSENLDVAYAIQENLENNNYYPTVWTQNFFGLSETTIESLVNALSNYDYAVFVFSPDDVTKLRDKEVNTVRDNVIFELGLFIGALGRKSCFFVIPKNAGNLHLPSDLLGITAAKYDTNRENLVAALGPACNQINRAIAACTQESIEPIDQLCSADWRVAEKRNLKAGTNIESTDTSNLFFLLLSVLDCEKSRILIADMQAEKHPDIKVDAMYDLMGSWDLLIKFRTKNHANDFESDVVSKLIDASMMDSNQNDVFGRRKLINVLSQSRNVSGLLSKAKKESIFYTLLGNSEGYESYRAGRAFIFLEAKGKKNDKQRKLFLEHLNVAINRQHSSSIIESVCEGESELIIETFSSCAQSTQISHLNKAVEPVLTAHGLQKYTLSCYSYDEKGLLEDSKISEKV